MSLLKINSIVDVNGGSNASINGYTPTVSNMAGRNRIINGDMRIDQRNAGAAVTASGSYPVDRFTMTNSTDGSFSAQQDTSAPVGFVNSLKVTTTTADTSLITTQYFSIRQKIEGFNVSDFGFGTANAKTVTLSFWVRSSLTGTFGGSIANSAATRSYPFTYTISVADTWEQKSVSIAGDTTGTWLTTNGIGVQVFFGLGAGPDRSGTAGAWNSNNNVSATGATSVVGTSGATFYITGVQLEAGNVATPFENVDYSEMLRRCQRYYAKMTAGTGTYTGFGIALGAGSTGTQTFHKYPQTMRAAPTLSQSNCGITNGYSATYAVTVNNGGHIGLDSATINWGVASGLTAGAVYLMSAYANNAAYIDFNSEL